jgi:hypothetical protein
MSMIISTYDVSPGHVADVTSRWVMRQPRSLRLMAAAALLMVSCYQFWAALQSPAQAIRGELTDAAYETRALAWRQSPEAVQAAIGRHFAGREVSVDPARFPVAVTVRLAGLDRATCLEARQLTRRIEGSVVVALQGYATAADCADQNTMSWRIMP